MGVSGRVGIAGTIVAEGVGEALTVGRTLGVAVGGVAGDAGNALGVTIGGSACATVGFECQAVCPKVVNPINAANANPISQFRCNFMCVSGSKLSAQDCWIVRRKHARNAADHQSR